MKIIIAPAKIMKPKEGQEFQDLIFPQKNQYLKTILAKYDRKELPDIMHISFKLANQVYNYYHQQQPITPAIYCFSGTVYQQLDILNYKEPDLLYLNKYVNIVDAYYGVLKPNTGIKPYRLDFSMNIGFNLYEYWQADIDRYFEKEDLLISLASREFSKMLNHPNLINIDFIEVLGNKHRRNSMYVKKARGMMLDLLIKNQVTSLKNLKALVVDGYSYNPKLSTKNNLVFIRHQRPKFIKK